MAWFKVDDKLHSHRKAARAGVAAMGLWSLAGSWCSDQLTDGFVPDYIAERLAPGESEHLAGRLVDAGLWVPGEFDGDTGWWFHEWDERQPMRADVEARRASERDKKRAQRRNTTGQFTPSPDMSPGDNDETDAGTPAGSRTVPDPTRPVPTSNTPSSADADGAFDEFWSACPRKVGKADARRRWHRAIRDVDPQVLIDAMAAHAERWAADGTDHRFIPHPATWLNQGRWADELVTQDTGPPEFRPNAQMARNARRAAGQACPTCADSGWVDLPDGSVAPCPCQTSEATG